MKSKLYLLLSLVILASMALTACSGTPTAAPTAVPPTAAAATAVAPTAAPTTAASNPDTIIIGTTDKVASLDPADAYSVHDWEMIIQHQRGPLEVETRQRADLVAGSGHRYGHCVHRWPNLHLHPERWHQIW